ncbi:hypothetical protein [Robiginitalea sp. IMCC43444]|uniref:hypothetical protein n=1 Tax=Robiginitalea sp. IMCC43444 TaxID=3459121 RepID=UPI0040429EED
MYRFLKTISTLCFCSLMMYSCYYDEALPAPPIPDVDPDTPISFRTDIEPLFSRDETNCILCHNGAIQDPDLRVGNAYNAIVPTYVTAGDAEGSLFYQRLPGLGHTVETGFELSTADISLIKSWIDRGAENN